MTVAETPAVHVRPRRGGGVIAVARRALAGLFALSWLVFPGFGLIDLEVTWDPAWSRVLEAGWGLYMTVILAVPFAMIAASARTRGIASTQLLVGAAALTIAAIVTLDWRLALLVALLAVEVLLVAGPPRPPRLRRPGRAWALLAVAIAGSPAWIAYAVAMWRAEFERVLETDYTLDIDHLSVQGALAIALPALAALAACWPAGRILSGLSAGVSAAYLGIVSFAAPLSPAAMPSAWSIACAAWGLVVAILSVVLGAGRTGIREPGPAAPSR